jgi:hypothetical protein
VAPRAKKVAAVAAALAGEPAAADEPRAIALRGSLDRADGDGRLEGWCWSPDEPAARREVALHVNGIEVARVLADRPRPDLLAAGVGDGAHSFVAMLDTALVVPDETAEILLRDGASGAALGAAVTVRWRSAQAAVGVQPQPSPPALAGSLDRVSRDGWVSGWCWYPGRPETRVELAVLVDDVAVGAVVADAFRSGRTCSRPGSATARTGSISRCPTRHWPIAAR